MLTNAAHTMANMASQLPGFLGLYFGLKVQEIKEKPSTPTIPHDISKWSQKLLPFTNKAEHYDAKFAIILAYIIKQNSFFYFFVVN